MERLKISQRTDSENRVPAVLKIWFCLSPTVVDLKAALTKWRHLALIAKFGLDKPFASAAASLPTASNSADAETAASLKEKIEIWKKGLGMLTIMSPSSSVFLQKKDENAQKDDKEGKDDSLCAICWERRREIAFIPCGHRCCCSICAENVVECPLCRHSFTSKLKVFG